ncbi:LysE family translocator [Microbulbifer epialgicus]|uniref:LysE family translocator n=1 Tax=Microbulbifer epialgicus TaxID=393907 RepID=A0ABV4NVJ8_9GAMM
MPITLFVFSASITPGPNNLMIMSSGLNHGARQSLPHLLGIWLGFPAMLVAVGLGLGSIFSNFPILHEVIRWLGIAYLLFLAWLIATTKQLDSASARRPFSFLQAVAFQWINPKGWVMAIGALAVFTSPSGGVWSDIATIALAFTAIGGPCVAVWLFFGLSLKKFLTEPRHLRQFNIVMGVLLATSIIPMALEDLH